MRDAIRFRKRFSPAASVCFVLCLQAQMPLEQVKLFEKAKVARPEEAIRTFPEPRPQDTEVAINEHKKILRAEIAIDSATKVRFYEEPTSWEVYNSSISIERQGMPIKAYNVGRMIRHQALRLVHTALIRSSGVGMLICEYEGGAVGAREGFAILRFSATGLWLNALPLTDFGKVVVFKENPDKVEIWTAWPDGAGPNASPKAYATRMCKWQPAAYLCGPPGRQRGRFTPGDIDDPGIEIRQ